MRNKAQRWVFEALEHVIEQKITSTRSRPGNKNFKQRNGAKVTKRVR